MQPVARHAQPYGRLEVVNQLELDFGRRVVARAAPYRADAEVDRGARVQMRHRVHAERERDVRAVLRGGADQRPVAPPERQYSTTLVRGWMQNSSWKRSGGICRSSSLVRSGILRHTSGSSR